MRMLVVILLGLLSVAAVAAGKTARLSFDSLGAVRVGMTPAQLQAAIGAPLKQDFPDDTERCRYMQPAAGPGQVSFMMIDDRLARIDVMDPGVSTVAGIHVGSPKSDVLVAYPHDVTVEPHAYTAPDGEYLTVYAPDHRHGIRFETDHDRVVSFYAGNADAIHYIEGCL